MYVCVYVCVFVYIHTYCGINYDNRKLEIAQIPSHRDFVKYYDI